MAVPTADCLVIEDTPTGVTAGVAAGAEVWAYVAPDAQGRLALAPGVLAHTNGIALLARRGFGPEVEASAGKVFDWLSAYLAQPAGSADVLA